jgi:hypothetical protein
MLQRRHQLNAGGLRGSRRTVVIMQESSAR